MRRKQPICIDDIYRFKIPMEPNVSPDGEQVVFAVERMHKKEKAYYSNLYLAGTNGRGSKQLTFGKRNDHFPTWSPNGKQIVFIRKRETTTQIWTLTMNGGEARPLTRLPRGAVSNLRWSPDGDKLLFLFHPSGREIKVNKKGKEKTPVYRHVKDIWYRLDDHGYFDSENTHVWVANARTGTVGQVVKGDYDDMSPCWSPDSKEIAFLSLREKDWRSRSEEQDIFRVSVSSGRIKTVPSPPGPKFGGLSYSPDGKTLAYIGHDKPYQDGWGVENSILNTLSVTAVTLNVFKIEISTPQPSWYGLS